MDETSKQILLAVGVKLDGLEDLNGQIIPREVLLSDSKYNAVKILIPELKATFSSSIMTSLQSNASKEQSWPLLNLVRQILSMYKHNMKPIRKSDGYTKEGVKKYKRFFEICTKKDNNVIPIPNDDVEKTI